jgi:CheY-like chemotaxis protein
MKKLNCILLVDDDETTNFFNKHLLNKLGVADKIQVTQNGQDALDYLTNQGKYEGNQGGNPIPDLILLDINMPVMNGFEFLEAYNKLDEENKSKAVICMLTTSLHQNDMEKAESYDQLSDYLYKPLNADNINAVIEKYFES